MTRAAIYARRSTDKQDKRSCEDQLSLCAEYTAKHGYEVVQVYKDEAVSGASLHGRTEFARVLADAEAGQFDVLLAESTSRIGRDQEDRAHIRKRLRFYGVRIETVADGVVNPMMDGIKAVMDEGLLDAIKDATRRGMSRRVKDGLSAGGKTYGYRTGETKGGLVIVEEEAAIVRRIFAEYAAGHSPRYIATRLNNDGIKAPRNGHWSASTITGNPTRGSGILRNTLYKGVMTWNRVTMRKNPRTGRRVSRPNPASEWIERAVPELRIVRAEMSSRTPRSQ